MSEMAEPGISKPRVLVVDDDANVRQLLSALLLNSGYLVDTAEDGFSALLSMKCTLPKLLLSDLNMPQMSGFELLSVVRRRFPEISVIAMSGAYECTGHVPLGVIADAFYPKGNGSVAPLLQMMEDLLRTSGERTSHHLDQPAPVWIPRNGHDARGRPFIVITCTHCLRSFPVNVAEEATPETLLTPCLFCATELRYIIDFSRSVTSPEKTIAHVAAAKGWSVVDGKVTPIGPAVGRGTTLYDNDLEHNTDVPKSEQVGDVRLDADALLRMDDEGGAPRAKASGGQP